MADPAAKLALAAILKRLGLDQAEPAAQPEAAQQPALMTLEQMQDAAYRVAKASAANSDGSGWSRLGVK